MSIKGKIRNTYLGAYCISLLHCVESFVLPRLVDDKKAVLHYYRKRARKDLDLYNPQSFSEKLNWYKLNDKNPLMPICADKYDVRAYVESKGYNETLNELLGVYDRVSDIRLDELPNQFAIKAAHGSHMNYIVDNKNEFSLIKAKLMMNTWLHQDIYWSAREWVYKDLKRRIIIEKYIEDESGGLIDYKFFCFNGKPSFVQYTGNRFSDDIVQNFYDLDWNLLPFGKSIPHNTKVRIKKPVSFEYMVEMAEALSEPFQFVRVDLYEVNGKVYFGELTFFPGGGTPDFIPECYDQVVGQKWELKK